MHNAQFIMQCRLVKHLLGRGSTSFVLSEKAKPFKICSAEVGTSAEHF